MCPGNNYLLVTDSSRGTVASDPVILGESLRHSEPQHLQLQLTVL